METGTTSECICTNRQSCSVIIYSRQVVVWYTHMYVCAVPCEGLVLSSLKHRAIGCSGRDSFLGSAGSSREEKERPDKKRELALWASVAGTGQQARQN